MHFFTKSLKTSVKNLEAVPFFPAFYTLTRLQHVSPKKQSFLRAIFSVFRPKTDIVCPSAIDNVEYRISCWWLMKIMLLSFIINQIVALTCQKPHDCNIKKYKYKQTKHEGKMTKILMTVLASFESGPCRKSNKTNRDQQNKKQKLRIESK